MSEVKGPALAAIGVGVVFIYAGLKDYRILTAVQNLVTGKNPAAGQTPKPLTIPGAEAAATSTSTGTGGFTQARGGTNAQNRTLGKFMATSYGWGSGAEWSALDWIVMTESGWSDTVVNANSSASGIAQNIAGWSSSYQKSNPAQQIAWLLSYIKGRYGDPIKAKAFHESHGWY